MAATSRSGRWRTTWRDTNGAYDVFVRDRVAVSRGVVTTDGNPDMGEFCVVCGDVIPEGRLEAGQALDALLHTACLRKVLNGRHGVEFMREQVRCGQGQIPGFVCEYGGPVPAQLSLMTVSDFVSPHGLVKGRYREIFEPCSSAFRKDGQVVCSCRWKHLVG